VAGSGSGQNICMKGQDKASNYLGKGLLSSLTESDLRPSEHEVDHSPEDWQKTYEIPIMRLYHGIRMKNGTWKLHIFKIFMSMSVQVEGKPVNLCIRMWHRYFWLALSVIFSAVCCLTTTVMRTSALSPSSPFVNVTSVQSRALCIAVEYCRLLFTQRQLQLCFIAVHIGCWM
jgi:hypothetical protein